MRYNSTWQINDETHGRWECNENMFDSRKAFYYWMYKIIKDNYALGETMGDKSVHGVVYHFTPSKTPKTKKDLFVLKTQRVRVGGILLPLMEQLRLEAKVGMKKGAPVPTVFAHRYNHTTGMYEILMQNVIKDTQYKEKFTATSMSKFIKSPKIRRNLVVQKFHDILVQFYKTTRHFHGDLHLENIVVTHDPNMTIDKIYIIDLGSVIPFTKNMNLGKLKYVSDFMEPITKVFVSLRRRENFTRWNINTVFGEIVWLQESETSVIHNLKQKQSHKFWEDVLLVGSTNQLTSHPLNSKKKSWLQMSKFFKPHVQKKPSRLNKIRQKFFLV